MNSKKKSVKIHSKKLTISVQEKKSPTYEKDFYKWTQQQAELLKDEKWKKLDIENLIEEIESLGRSEKRTLKSYLEILLMHMLKAEYQPEKHTRSWDLSIKNSKFKANKILKENPSLKPTLNEILKDAYFSARLDAALETGLDEKKFPKECPWKNKEILG